MNETFLSLFQWPAMVVSLGGAWWLGDNDRKHRHWGFIALLISNVLWIAWGWKDGAWALVALQFAFIVMNVRGLFHTQRKTPPTVKT